MDLKKVSLICLLFVCLFILTSGTGWSSRQLETQSVQLRGSSTVEPLMQQVAKMYMQENPGTVVTVTSIGTMRGVKSLINATSNIAMASSDISVEMDKLAKDNDAIMNKHVIAYDALVPIVHPGNGVNNLTVEELGKVFSGEITNWQQLGGADLPVIVASYNRSSGSYETWKDKIMKQGKVITLTAKILSAESMTNFVRQNPGAIGYVTLPYLNNTIKPLTVGGVSSDAGNITSRKYPVSRELALYTTKDCAALVNKFVDYALASDKGQQFIKRAGVIPVK